MLNEINPSYLLGTIINPLTPYFLCNHYIASEIIPGSDDYVPYKYPIIIPYGTNNLLINKNYNAIKNNDIIVCQVNYFDLFSREIFPTLGNKKIILITSQWAYPALERSDSTDKILASPNIILWISQNPIYENNDKYMAFPYGINMKDISLYYSHLAGVNMDISGNRDLLQLNKNKNILHTNLNVEEWYPEDHIRRNFSCFGTESPDRIGYVQYLKELTRSRYILSPQGDRPDCYRNYEAIGLGCIPIANLDGEFKRIFGENMIYRSGEEMQNILQTSRVVVNGKDKEYKLPDRRIILSSYWREKIIERIKNLV
tara:strand:- start:1250 stop:2191 length:942 start_codon:yes stop_codon:yes gene_type:complete